MQGGKRQSQYCVPVDVLDLVHRNFAYTCIADLIHIGRFRYRFFTFYDWTNDIITSYSIGYIRNNENGRKFGPIEDANDTISTHVSVYWQIFEMGTFTFTEKYWQMMEDTSTSFETYKGFIFVRKQNAQFYEYYQKNMMYINYIDYKDVNRAILNISTNKSHPFHIHFKSLYAKKISELTMHHNANN